ncbi:MAG: protease modulator HflK [Limisphaerales bacterium]
MSDEHSILTKPTLPDGPVSEDAGSQALSEALKSSFFIVKFIMVGLVLIFLGSGFFIVKEGYRAIILRFGNPVGQGEQALLGPGYHWAWPAPIDTVEQIPIKSIQTAESTVGWYAGASPFGVVGPDNNSGGNSLNPATESYAITADANIIHVAAQLRYRISDPIQFHFNFTDATFFVTNALNNALIYTASQFNVDDALVGKTAAFRERVAARLKDLVETQKLGITVEQVDVVAVPPQSLQPKFSEFLQATVKREQLLNNADIYTNQVYSLARAEFESRTNRANADRTFTVQLANAEAKKFLDLLPKYEANPELFTSIRQLETLQKVYANAYDKYPMPHGHPLEIRTQLNREPRKEGAQTNSVPQ